MKYFVLVHKSKYGYDVHVPSLPGCHSQGATRKEALINIQDAILSYLTADGSGERRTELREVEVSLA